jgi:hypothetical protein
MASLCNGDDEMREQSKLTQDEHEELVQVPVKLMEKAARHVGDLACIVMANNGGMPNTIFDVEDELRALINTAR